MNSIQLFTVFFIKWNESLMSCCAKNDTFKKNKFAIEKFFSWIERNLNKGTWNFRRILSRKYFLTFPRQKNPRFSPTRTLDLKQQITTTPRVFRNGSFILRGALHSNDRPAVTQICLLSDSVQWTQFLWHWQACHEKLMHKLERKALSLCGLAELVAWLGGN